MMDGHENSNLAMIAISDRSFLENSSLADELRKHGTRVYPKPPHSRHLDFGVD